MAFGVRLHVWGDYACFTRPEMKVERVSYDAMTPSAARGVLEAIHWKPAIRWVVDRIHVLNPIRFENLRRNELGHKISTGSVRRAMRSGATESLRAVIEDDRQQRATTLLRDVAYVIDAHFMLTDDAQADDTEAKHLSMFNRRAAKGQCFHRPYLGTREFAADFALVTDQMPQSYLPDEQQNRDLGWMLHDIDYAHGMAARYFRAKLQHGAIEVPPLDSAEVKA
ncbi:MAG: type I-C CRISPR-associated protein Cas5c [Gammaproteobacteria bacterium]|nr:type I-C CRISPR-associated protein Cas5c [Gammaproteobacteria bacterium]